jgi:sialate O-acetylesterase
MRKAGTFASLAFVIFSIGASESRAAVKLPPMFSEHMVLQRDVQVPVWGTASPGEKVTVKFRGQEQSAEADKDGKWVVKLAALKAGGPDSLTINTTAIQDVLVGDVWVGSGQSNMAMGTSSYTAHDAALEKNVAAGPYPQIRIIMPHGSWKESTPANLGGFSAILFSFGLPLQKEINVPVGLMVGAVGGTPSGAWLNEDALEADPAVHELVQKDMATYDPKKDQETYVKALADWEKQEVIAKATGKRGQRKPEVPGKPGEMTNGQKAGYLFKANVEPYIPFAIKGVLWDQGESGTAVRGVDQYTLMGALIKGWRKEWGQGDFPFLYIQKPSGGGIAWDPKDPITANAEKFSPALPKAPAGNEGAYRETHIKIREYPNTFMVTASDLGGGTHPISKSAYGVRASRVALGAVYGQKVEIYGPVPEGSKVVGDKIRVTFTHVGQGLAAAQSDKLQGFEVAGDDKKFYWADATIEGDSVVLQSKQVSKPVAVRYAWNGSFPWANLFNKDGLPAQTFRTDSW